MPKASEAGDDEDSDDAADAAPEWEAVNEAKALWTRSRHHPLVTQGATKLNTRGN